MLSIVDVVGDVDDVVSDIVCVCVVDYVCVVDNVDGEVCVDDVGGVAEVDLEKMVQKIQVM